MTEINITLAKMTAAELRAVACDLLERMTDAQVDCLSELIKKEVQTLTAAERTELLNKLREIKKGSAKLE